MCYDQALFSIPFGDDSAMRRRHWLVTVALIAAGCSSSGKGPKDKRRKTAREKLHRGPQGFGNVLASSYIDDLKSGSAQKKIAAANHLADMGPDAKAALPQLEKLAGDKDPKVSAAAKAAAAKIKKR